MLRKLLIVSSLLTTPALAQPNECSCTKVFNEAAEKVEQVYSGYKDKITSKTKPEYIKRKERYGKLAGNTYNMLECHQLTIDFLEFYKDNHIFLQFSAPGGKSNRQVLKVSDKEIKNIIDKEGPNSELSGIWETIDNKYRFALVPYKSIAAGFTLITLAHPDTAWKHGTVKAVLTSTGTDYPKGYLYHDDFGLQYTFFSLHENTLDIGAFQLHRKVDKNRVAKAVETWPKNVTLEKLDNNNLYVRAPLFTQGDVKKLDSIFDHHRTEIERATGIIIDIRDNGGGDSNPPMDMIRILGIDTLKTPYWDYRVSKLYLDKIEARMKAGRADSSWYKKFKNAKAPYWRENTVRLPLDSVRKQPLRIAVLMNEGCASAAEMYIYYAKQGKDVTLFGKHSSGTMDYGPTDNFPLSCDNFNYFSIPYGRNGWVDSNPIDKVGFQPDVEIPANTNWVKFVLDRWKKEEK